MPAMFATLCRFASTSDFSPAAAATSKQNPLPNAPTMNAYPGFVPANVANGMISGLTRSVLLRDSWCLARRALADMTCGCGASWIWNCCPGYSPAGTGATTICPDGVWNCTIWPGETPAGNCTCIMASERRGGWRTDRIQSLGSLRAALVPRFWERSYIILT